MRYLTAAVLALSPLAAGAIEVRQSGTQLTISPVAGSQPVVGFYDYGGTFAASANTGFEADDVSILFLYSDGGRESLVMINDVASSGDGGEATLSVSGLPSAVVFAVQDDPSTGFPADSYSPVPPTGGQTTASWRWSDCCTDGMALIGMETEPYCVALDPSFSSGISSWQVIDSGGTRTTLPSLSATTWLCDDCQRLTCPDQVVAECDGDGNAFVDLRADGDSLCPGANIRNDRTGGGADASDFYPLGTTRVRFTLSDDPGFRSTCETLVVVEDTAPPLITTCPAALELPCDGGAVAKTDPRVQAWIDSFAASDVCDDVTRSDDVPAFLPVSCDGIPIGVTFTATDLVGLTATCPSSVKIVDADPPTVDACPAAVELECDDPAGVPRGDPRLTAFFAGFLVSDDCSDPTISDDAPALFPSGCGPGVTTDVTFTATDGCGRAVSCTSSVTVRDTTPPDAICPTDRSFECTAPGATPSSDADVVAWAGGFRASDLCGGVDPSDDLPSQLAAGCPPGTTTDVTFTAADDCDLSSSCVARATVVDTTPPAILTCPAPLALECSEMGGVSASDPQVVAFRASFTADDLCFDEVLADDAPGFFSSGCAPGEVTAVAFTATDDCGNADGCGATVTVQDTTPPDLTAPGDLTLECKTAGGTPKTDAEIQAWLASLAASDVCADVTVSDDGPALFPSACSPGAVTKVLFSAVDTCGNSASESRDVTVTDTRAPQLLVPAPLTLECDDPTGVPFGDPRIQAWLGAASASDVCDAATLTSDAPALFAPGCAPGLATTVTFDAVDDCGNATRQPSTINVVDSTPPDLTVPATLELECNSAGGVPLTDPRVQAWLASATATDACGAASVGDDAPALIPAACDGAPTVVTFTAVDDCGNTTVDTASIIVRDTTAPVLTVPAPLTLECNAAGGVLLADPAVQAWIASASASDTCATPSLGDDAPALLAAGCVPGTTTTVTFTATDDCGNATALTSTVTVVDSTFPDLTVPPPLTLECNSPGGVPLGDPQIQAWLGSVTSRDVCGGFRLSDDAPALFPSGCGPGATTVVSFRSVDDCGNTTTLTSTVTVVDTTPPDLTVPVPLTLECNSPGGVPLGDSQIQAWLARVSSRDVCDGVTLSDDAPALFPSGCGAGTTTTVTFTSVDDCGNTTALSSTVTVVDTTPPALTVPPALELECSSPGGVPGDDPRIAAWLGSFAADDVCDGATLSDDAPAFFNSGCVPGEVTTVTFSAVDDCGNAASDTSTVTVVDTTAPDVTALLSPLEPLSPSSARSPRSVCSPPASRAFRVDCAAVDACDEAPAIEARLLAYHADVPAPETCETRVDSIPVACGEELEIRLLAPLCPSKPRSPRSSLSVRSDGTRVVSAEKVVLEVTATDDCGNAATVTHDPSEEPSPLCEEVLDDGTCCPAIGQPPPPKCRVAPCELATLARPRPPSPPGAPPP